MNTILNALHGLTPWALDFWVRKLHLWRCSSSITTTSC